MNTVAEPNPAQTRSRPSRRRLFAWVRTLNLASACLLAAAAISLLVVIAQAPEVVHQLFRDADQDVSLVLPQLASHLPSGSNVDLGDHSWYEAWWFNRATIGLPDHFLIWEYAPYVILLLGIATVAWSVRIALGRRAALYTVVALLAIGSALRPVAFQPQGRVEFYVHLGVLAIALLMVWRQALDGALSRRRLVMGGVGVAAFTAVGGTDQLLFVAGIFPYIASGCLWWWLNGTRAARTVGLFALVTGTASLFGSELIWTIMQHEGVTATLGIHDFLFIGSGQIGLAVTNFISSWVGLGNGAFFGGHIDRSGLVALTLGFGTLVVLGAVIRLWYRSLTDSWRSRVTAPLADTEGARQLFIIFWGGVVVATIASDALTSWGIYDANPRFLIAGWIGAAALLGALVSSRPGRAMMTIGLIAFAVTIAVQDVHDGVPTPVTAYPSAAVTKIRQFVSAHRATIGYVDYWRAESLTWETHFSLEALPVWPCPTQPDELCWRELGAINAWYVPRRGVNTFVIVDAGDIPVPRDFGSPIATDHVGQYTVDIFNHDVAAQLLSYDAGTRR